MLRKNSSLSVLIIIAGGNKEVSLYKSRNKYISDYSINYKVIVLNLPFNNSYSDLRNAALDMVDTEWVLFLDSDEVISDELLEIIPKLISSKTIDGYWIARKTFISKNKYLRFGLFYPDYQMRLFRKKSEYRFVGAVHEQLTIPENKTAQVKEPLLHYPRNPKYTSFSDYKNLTPYIDIQAEELVKRSHQNRKNPLSQSITLFISGTYQFFFLFLSGFIRGKGCLDGWDGFRAHLMLAASIGHAYIKASIKILQ